MSKVWALAAALLSVFGSGAEAVQYRIVDLGTLGGDKSYAYAINDGGQVVGNYHTGYIHNGIPSHAFLWRNAAYVDLGPLGGYYNSGSQVLGINNNGQVVGRGANGRAFLWDNGAMTDLGSLISGGTSYANDINEAGNAVGWSGAHAVLWQNGGITDLGFLGGAGNTSNPSSCAYGINNSGWVVGISSADYTGAFLWRDGAMTDLGVVGCAYAVSDGGQVVGGWSGTSGHAFLWQNGGIADLGTLGGDSSCAYGLNNLGQVVGGSRRADYSNHAFLWQNGVMTDLGALPGGNYSQAQGINSVGQVVGFSSAANGAYHAVLWVPVPEPSSLLALLCGVGGLLSLAEVKRSRCRRAS